MLNINFEVIKNKCVYKSTDNLELELFQDYIYKLTNDNTMYILNPKLHKKYSATIQKIIENEGFIKTGRYIYKKV